MLYDNDESEDSILPHLLRRVEAKGGANEVEGDGSEESQGMESDEAAAVAFGFDDMQLLGLAAVGPCRCCFDC